MALVSFGNESSPLRAPTLVLNGLWRLAATLGARSSFKKLPKRDVMGADIAQLCDLIAEPVEPLALRLSSNLMVGVARWVSCEYVMRLLVDRDADLAAYIKARTYTLPIHMNRLKFFQSSMTYFLGTSMLAFSLLKRLFGTCTHCPRLRPTCRWASQLSGTWITFRAL